MIKRIKLAWHKYWRDFHEYEERIFERIHYKHARKATLHFNAIERLTR